MGPATIRRFALVAAMVLLAPVWCKPAALVQPIESPRAPLIGLAPTGGSSMPAIRRSAVAGGWIATSRTDYGRGPVAVVVVALLSLLTLIRWAPVSAARSAPSPLVRRRHIIALRAPPLRLLPY